MKDIYKVLWFKSPAISGMFIFIVGVLIGSAVKDKKSGWNTFVEEETSTHTIESPFSTRDNICAAVVLDGKIGVHCIKAK